MREVSSIPPSVKRDGVTDFVWELISSRAAVALLLFAFAFFVRLYFVWTHPNFDNIFSVRGVPYSDSSMWVSAAIKLARGEGLGAVYRPGLSILLALFYLWFGTSFNLVSGINLFTGAVTAALIYLVGERVFTRGIAAAATLFFVFDPSQLNQMPQATTEPLGLMLFVGSVYCVLTAEGGKRLRLSFLSGALLALSNLTRPLTLLCAPCYAIYFGIIEWLRSRRLTPILLPMSLFCVGIALTMAPWLVRQKLVYGVGAASTNMAEALYAATSPKYKTWKYTVQAEADRDGIAPTVGARYRYFMAESLKNIQRYPFFYAGQISRSYWNFLNSFSYAARSDSKAFEYNQWSGLVEAQILFLLVLIGFLSTFSVRFWICSGAFAGIIFGLISVALLMAWHLAPFRSGAAIILFGVVMGILRCHRPGVVLLGLSLAVSGLSDAIFNNAILYRAVMMTDWIVSLFYLASFSLCATLIAEFVVHYFREDVAMAAGCPAEISFHPSVSSLQKAVKIAFMVVIASFGAFALAGSIRLAAVNFGGVQPSKFVQLRLSNDDKREVIRQLRRTKPALQAVLPDSGRVNLTFTDTRRTFNSAALTAGDLKPKPGTDAKQMRNAGAETQLVVFKERLPPFLYFFPGESEFELRNRLFKRRRHSCTTLLTSHGTVVFPGEIPRHLKEHDVVFVGWVEGVHPNGVRYGEVMQCVAIIPVISRSSTLDYEHAIAAKPQEGLL